MTYLWNVLFLNYTIYKISISKLSHNEISNTFKNINPWVKFIPTFLQFRQIRPKTCIFPVSEITSI